MANAQILRNTVVEIQSALGTALTITGISQATEAVVTATNSLSTGDLVVITGVVGMIKMNDRVVRVKSATASDFVCEGVDSTNFTAWVSGGQGFEVTTTVPFDNISQISLPDAPPDEIDVTAISDAERQLLFGHDAAQKGTITLIADPLSAAVMEVTKAGDNRTRRVFKVTLESGYVAIFNAFCAGGAGFDGGVSAAGTSQVSLTLKNKPQWFAS